MKSDWSNDQPINFKHGHQSADQRSDCKMFVCYYPTLIRRSLIDVEINSWPQWYITAVKTLNSFTNLVHSRTFCCIPWSSSVNETYSGIIKSDVNVLFDLSLTVHWLQVNDLWPLPSGYCGVLCVLKSHISYYSDVVQKLLKQVSEPQLPNAAFSFTSSLWLCTRFLDNEKI